MGASSVTERVVEESLVLFLQLSLHRDMLFLSQGGSSEGFHTLPTLGRLFGFGRGGFKEHVPAEARHSTEGAHSGKFCLVGLLSTLCGLGLSNQRGLRGVGVGHDARARGVFAKEGEHFESELFG